MFTDQRTKKLRQRMTEDSSLGSKADLAQRNKGDNGLEYLQIDEPGISMFSGIRQNVVDGEAANAENNR